MVHTKFYLLTISNVPTQSQPIRIQILIRHETTATEKIQLQAIECDRVIDVIVDVIAIYYFLSQPKLDKPESFSLLIVAIISEGFILLTLPMMDLPEQ